MLNENCHQSLSLHSTLYLNLGHSNVGQDTLLQCLTSPFCVKQGKTQSPKDTIYLFTISHQSSIIYNLFTIYKELFQALG